MAGVMKQKKSDAIHHASTPFIDSLYEKYPNSELRTMEHMLVYLQDKWVIQRWGI